MREIFLVPLNFYFENVRIKTASKGTTDICFAHSIFFKLWQLWKLKKKN